MSTNQVLAAVTTPPVDAAELSLLKWHGLGFEIRLGIVWFVLFVAIAAIFMWVLPWLQRKFMRGFRTRSVTLKFNNAEWEICPDTETRRIAHQAWVEMKTRKVGLSFEEGHDVIAEIYNSWYQIFGVLRELAKSIPADRLHDCDDTHNVVALLMKALNDGLRPHLTKWQAKFRRWYDAELAKEENKSLSPQDIQRKYPQYAELVADLRKVNEEFVTFADALKKVVNDGN